VFTLIIEIRTKILPRTSTQEIVS